MSDLRDFDDAQLLRNFALEQAVAANPNATADTIARDAAVFLAFLKGEQKDD